MIAIGQRRAYGHLTIIVAEAGDGKQSTTKSMNTSNLSLASRKSLADMLNDRYDGFRYTAKRKWGEKADLLRKSVLEDFAEKKGATTVLRQIEAGSKKLQDLKLELQQLGFELYGDRLRTCGSSNGLDKLVEQRVEKEIGSCADIDARFESAQIAMMTVPTLEDARKLFESVVNN
jgi:hypothetical protein